MPLWHYYRIGHAGALPDHHEFVGHRLNHGCDFPDCIFGVLFEEVTVKMQNQTTAGFNVAPINLWIHDVPSSVKQII